MSSVEAGPSTMEVSTLRELVGNASRYLRTAVIVGMVVWLPVATLAWWADRAGPEGILRHTDRFTFTSMPADLGPLRDWMARQPDVVDVEVQPAQRPEDKDSSETVELRYGSRSQQALAPPWKELGYAQPTRPTHHWSGKINIAIGHDIGFYIFLLARCLDLGFLIAAIVWFLRARRSGQPLPGLFRGAARRAAVWGLGTGLVLAGLALLYWWLVPFSEQGITGAWPLAIFWPGWAWILSLGLLPVVFPLCQELFFRGALLGSFQAAGRAKTGILVSALLFTIAQLNFYEAPVFLVMGLAQAWLYNRTRSLLAPLVAGFVCAALAITLPSFVIGPEIARELLQKTVEAMQNLGK